MKKYIICFLMLVFLAGCGEAENVPTSGETVMNNDEFKSVTISCAGDCTLGTDESFGGLTFPVELENRNNDYGWFFRNVSPIFKNDDLTIVNFEGTLTDGGIRENKTYAFKGSPEYTRVLTEGGVEAVTLANNHSSDYGEVSSNDTKMHLENAGIVWFENLSPAIVEINDIKIGLIGLYDLDGSAESVLQKTMEKVKNDGAELVVVEVHWGIEKENYPTSRQIALAHTAIDLGADMVMGHHPHVLQGVEEYKGKMIVYSLGNFCFGGNQNPRDKDSMIFKQTFTFKNGQLISDNEWGIYPCSISSEAGRNNYQPTVKDGAEGDRIKEKILNLSKKLGTETVNFYYLDE